MTTRRSKKYKLPNFTPKKVVKDIEETIDMNDICGNCLQDFIEELQKIAGKYHDKELLVAFNAEDYEWEFSFSYCEQETKEECQARYEKFVQDKKEVFEHETRLINQELSEKNSTLSKTKQSKYRIEKKLERLTQEHSEYFKQLESKYPS